MYMQNKIEQLEKELAEMKQKLDKLNKLTRIAPPPNSDYYAIDDDGTFFESVWTNDETDKLRLSIGNVFETEKEVRLALEKLKLLTEIKQWRKMHDPDGFDPDWSDYEVPKYIMKYDFVYKEWGYDVTHNVIHINSFYLSSENNAESFLEYFGNRLDLLLEDVI